jgi:hypothetical protein
VKKTSPRRHRHVLTGHEEVPPPTKSELAELKRITAELDDPTRYLVASAFTRRFVLYYNVESGCFAMNDPSGGTLFKQRSAALAVLSSLQEGKPRSNLEVLKARKTKQGIQLREKPVAWLEIAARSGKIGNPKSKI